MNFGEFFEFHKFWPWVPIGVDQCLQLPEPERLRRYAPTLHILFLAHTYITTLARLSVSSRR